ncbi:MAG: hypothetical protein ABIQ02_08450 [Saprospiraceae bacterium]
MKTNYLSQTESQNLEEQFFNEAEQILAMQMEINTLEDQMVRILESITKRDPPKIDVIDFRDMLHLKEISDDIEEIQEAMKNPIKKLYRSLFPGNMFVIQYVYDAWVKVKPNWLIRFGDGLESIEIKKTDELN